MRPKKELNNVRIRKLEKMTVKLKKEIIYKHENGVRVTDLARQYGKSTSTISTILKDKEKLKSADVAKGVKILTKQRPKAIDDVEKLLLVWINQKQLIGECVSEAMICAKAKELYVDIVKQNPGSSDSEKSSFKASRGWFDNFKRRSGIHKVKQEVNTNKAEEEKKFQEFLESKGNLSQVYKSEVMERELSSTWGKLWPQSFFGLDSKSSKSLTTPASEQDKSLDLEAGKIVVKEEQIDDLTIEELQALHDQQQRETALDISSKEKEEEKNVSPSTIKEMLATWERLSQFVEETHPDKVVATRAVNVFNDTIMSHFRQVLTSQQKQVSTSARKPKRVEPMKRESCSKR